MKYTVQERLTIMNEVLKVVEGDKAAIKMARYGNPNAVTKQIIKNILEQGVNRKPGALLTQIGLCTTGCFIEDSVAWNNHSTAQLYRTIYMACKK